MRRAVVSLDQRGRVFGTQPALALQVLAKTARAHGDIAREDRDAFPLSLALPLAGRAFDGVPVERYLRGLLTDDGARLRRLAAQYGVEATDAYALLAQLGEDCPGAVLVPAGDTLM